jgi:DNA-binding NtrC family response regulator
MQPRVLLVEDDPASLAAIVKCVELEGFAALTARSLREARAVLEDDDPALVLLDLKLPDGSGMELLESADPRVGPEVVIVTGNATVQTAVEALRQGAGDYLTKPVDIQRLRKILSRTRERLEYREEIDELRDELRNLGRFGSMVGRSRPMQSVYDMITRVAPTDATVLVQGDTGTGKELVAETVHRMSNRRKGPFLPINCSAVAPNIIESELFGHERGSFTGASKQHRGIFARAHGGTLFLDEISEMPLDLQTRFLRVLETGSFTPVGGERAIHVDVRVIAATNRVLDLAVEEGSVRRDLLYRLMVFPIQLPPLRDRNGDVDLLAGHFLEQLNRRHGTSKRLTRAARARLIAHQWPGNVRELKHALERAYIIAPTDIDTDAVQLDGAPALEVDSRFPDVRVGMSIAESERNLILATLEHTSGNKREAADILGISLKTLYNRLNAYDQAGALADADDGA